MDKDEKDENEEETEEEINKDDEEKIEKNDENNVSESSDESMESSDEDTEKLEELILKKLLKIKKFKKTNKKDDNIVPFLNKFLAKDMHTRYTKITPKHVSDLMYINRAILDKKIEINLKDSELELLHYVQHDVHSKDMKLVLAEDYNLHIIYKRALRVLEKELKRDKK